MTAPSQDSLASLRLASERFAETELDPDRRTPTVALEQLIQLTGADAGAIALPRADGDVDIVAERRLGRAGPVSRTVLRDAVANQANEASVIEPTETGSVLEARIVSVLCVPVRRRGRTLAAVYLDRRGLDREPFDDDARELAASFASGVALALDLAGEIRQADAKRTEAERLAEEARAVAVHLRDWWRFGSTVTNHPDMAQSLRLAEKAAPSDISVLICGETGTGKEHLARCIHESSQRKAGPFVALNCAAIPESLIESELFGIEARVATGVDARQGVFRNASGGTLFLDEVGDLPPAMQPKLLQVLESHRVRPLGGSRELEVDVRVLAATNRDLDHEMREGRFREDLFYRLAVAAISLPPLRQRREDIGPLADALLQAEAEKEGRKLTLRSSAAQRLAEHDWPGNVRELRNVIQLLVLLAPRELVSRADVDNVLRRSLRGPRPGSSEASAGRTFREQMDATARAILTAALEEGGTITEAARILGLARQTVAEKCRNLGIPLPSRRRG